MDISKWLDEIVLPQHPVDVPALPRTAPPHQVHNRKPGTGTRPLPNRSQEDSSILEPYSAQRNTLRKQQIFPTGAETAKGAHGEGPVSSCCESSHGNASSQRYVRRPRRKTRPDRYEAFSKVADERDTFLHRSRKDEPKKARRRTKRKTKGNVGGDSGHDFRASNVLEDRLTLKPRAQPGIFNKGRTSTAVKGRGLPDLVFSEMKFLQQQSEQSCLPRREEVTRKRRKKDHIQFKEGEISAFFAHVRPALAEKDHNLPDQPRASGGEGKSITTQREAKSIAIVDNAEPTIETHDKASRLGHGNRDMGHKSSSYVTWSESSRAQSITSSRLPDRTEESRSTDLFRISSTDSSRLPGSRAKSLPHYASSSGRANMMNRSVTSPRVEKPTCPTAMPPQLSLHAEPEGNGSEHRSRTIPALCTNKTHPHRQRDTSGIYEYSDAAPSTSSDLVKTLQQCKEIFQHLATTDRACSARHEKSRSVRSAGRWTTPFDVDSATQQARRVRFADRQHGRPAMANIVGPGLFEQQAQNIRTSRRDTDEDVEELARLGRYYYCHVEDGQLDHEDDMASDMQPWEALSTETLAVGREVEAAESSGVHGSVVAAGFWRPNRLY